MVGLPGDGGLVVSVLAPESDDSSSNTAAFGSSIHWKKHLLSTPKSNRVKVCIHFGTISKLPYLFIVLCAIGYISSDVN